MRRIGGLRSAGAWSGRLEHHSLNWSPRPSGCNQLLSASFAAGMTNSYRYNRTDASNAGRSSSTGETSPRCGPGAGGAPRVGVQRICCFSTIRSTVSPPSSFRASPNSSCPSSRPHRSPRGVSGVGAGPSPLAEHSANAQSGSPPRPGPGPHPEALGRHRGRPAPGSRPRRRPAGRAPRAA